MKPSRSVASLMLAASFVALSAACSLLYSDYGGRFAPPPFVVEDAGIRAMTVATSGIYYAVAGKVLSVAPDGGASRTVWRGDGGQVLALESDGVDHLAWTLSTTTGTPNTLFLTTAPEAASALPVEKGGTTYANVMGADSTQLAWSAGSSLLREPGNLIVYVASWATDAAATPLSLPDDDDAAGGTPMAIGVKTVAVAPNGVYARVDMGGLALFSATSGGILCRESVVPPAEVGAVALAVAPTGSLFIVGGATGGSLTRYDVDGGCPSSSTRAVTIDSTGDAVLVAADDTGVYWVRQDGSVWWTGLTGATPQTLGTASALSGTSSIGLGGGFVYLATGNAIYRFAKGGAG